MDLAAVFADLDRVAWPELEHAYGPAEDVPALLRALSSDDEETVAEAEEELWSSLVHQGTVYTATVAAVPFLTALAVAGVQRVKLLGVLGCIAESADEHKLDRPGAAADAVVAQLPLLLPFLADADPEVRQCAAWAVAQCGPAAGDATRAALRECWAAETDPVVRADVLTACVTVDPDAAEELCAAAFDEAEPPSVRVAALLAGVANGRPWTAELAALVATLSPLKQHLGQSQWGRVPLNTLTDGLRERGQEDAAADVVLAVLEHAVAAVLAGADPETAGEATSAAGSLALRSRSAPARLLPALLPLLDVPAAADAAIDAVRYWAEPAPQAVPALLKLAEGTGKVADHALAALVSLGVAETEVADLLARDLTERPRALEAASRLPLRQPPAPLPRTPALLDAVRTRLAAWAADAASPREQSSSPTESPADRTAAYNEPVQLCWLLVGWGSAARIAIPALLEALPHRPDMVGKTLATVADPTLDPAVVTALRAAAGARSLSTRQAAATALHTLTGDAGPLLTVLAAALDARDARHERAVKDAAALGEQARPLLPHLLALLAEPAEARTTTPAIQTAMAAAAAVWELTGDQELVLPLVREGLGWAAAPWGGGHVASQAAKLATLLGPAAQPAVPHLLPLLDRPDAAVAATRALLAAHPGSDRPAGVPLGDLVDRVLAVTDPGTYLGTGLAALEALAALGPAAFTPAQLDRVRLLAEGDERVARWGGHTEIITGDVEFRAAARRVLAELSS